MRSLLLAVGLTGLSLTAAQPAAEAPNCKTHWNSCTGQVTCEDRYCSSVPLASCQMQLVSTPYGIGVSCVCAGPSYTEPKCCDLVVLPGGDGDAGVPVRVGNCPTDIFDTDCPLFFECYLHTWDEDGYVWADCFPPPD